MRFQFLACIAVALVSVSVSAAPVVSNPPVLPFALYPLSDVGYAGRRSRRESYALAVVLRSSP